ncbi:MAG TPA: hypothetical protein VIK28_07275 [Sedimentisphaerales bacterium]
MKTSAKIVSLFIVLLGFVAPSHVEATITKDQAVQYVQNAWGIVDLSSDVISKTLDTSYSGVPYTDWIDFLINAPSIYQPLSTGDYSTAARNAYNYGSGVAFAELISECGLTGVAAPAELAVWPIQQALGNFYNAVADASVNKQCQFYFAARSAGNTMDQIINMQNYDVISADTSILPTSSTLTKINGWLCIGTSYLIGGPPGFIPAQFYAYAEKQWLARQAASSFNAASSQLAQNFHDAAVSGPATAPTITIGPSSVTVSVGDTATFTVTASGTGPLYYHWQRNGVDIPNATFWYYITPPAQSSNNGDQYRVRVTNAQGNPTSGAATLTVSGVASGNAPVINTVSPSTLLTSASPQPIKIIGTGFTSSSTLLFNGSIASDPARLTFVSANEIDYNIIVLSAGGWSVQVVNGGQTSTAKSFTVNTPSASTGSLVVNLSPAGANSAGAQWQVDGTGYNSSGQVVGYLTPGSHTVSFKPISGYTTPANQIVTINANAQTIASGTYSVIAPNTYTLTLNYNPAQGGASPSPLVPELSHTYGSYSFGYTVNSVTLVQASATTGYHFTGWSGDASGTANPITLTMNGNKTVTANFASGDPNMGTVIVTIQPPEAAAAGVTWGFNDNDFHASGISYSTWPGTYYAYLHGTNGWVGVGGWITFTAGQTTNYTFAASYTNGSIIGNDPRTYYTLAGLAGSSGSVDGTNSAARFYQPVSLAVDNAGNVFVADSWNSLIRKVTPAGIVTTVAGKVGVNGYADGQGTNAMFNNIQGIAVDNSDNLYVADMMNSVIRKITPNGTVSTFAGQAGSNDSIDATGSAARFYFPTGIAADTNGNVYVADSVNQTIRKITPSAVVTTMAGSPRNYGYADGTGGAARFHTPQEVAVDTSGNVYVADHANQVVRKVTQAGVVTTIAGYPGSSGAADGTGSSARFNNLDGVAVDNAGNIYVADQSNQAIRKITPSGIVTTLAGQSGNPGSADGIGSVTRFDRPLGVAIDGVGTLYVADSGNSTIRATQPLTTPVNQFIAFAPLPDKSAGDAPFTLTVTSSSGLPVYLNVLSGPASLGTNNILTLLGGGTVNLVAWQPGNSSYNAAAPVLQSFNVSKIPQIITFGSLSQQKQGDAPFPLNATANSGLPVSFSIISGPATLSGNILVLNGWGTVTVSASQPGNNSYATATSVTQSFFVTPPDNTIVSPQRLPNGSFQLAFYGLTSSNYTIKTSTNLITWQIFTNFTGSNMLFYFNDPAATNFKQRFYRVMP